MTLSRREMIRNSSFGVGALVLSPILKQIRAQAEGIKSPPRFVFLVEGNGLNPGQVTPPEIKRKTKSAEMVDVSLEDYSLPESLSPLQAYRDRITLVHGLSGKVTGGGHSTDFGALGVYNCGSGVGNSGSPQGETIDLAIAKNLGGIFPHLCVGISDKPEHSVIYNCSAWGRGKPVPTICNPMTSYSHLFGSVAGENSKAEFQAKTNLLDFLRDDVKRLQQLTPGSEREKLESHLAGYEEMRNRQSRLGEIEGTLRQVAPPRTDKFQSEVETDRLDAQFDVAAAALIGGLTNCVTIASGVGNPYFSVRFDGLGIGIGKHGIGHGGSYDGLNAGELMVKIRKFHFELMAGLMQKLDSVPEGNGTMLDNTVIVYLSDAAEGHHSRCWEWPFVLIPGKNTGLQGGRYIDYPYYGNNGHREIGNLYATLLTVVGEEREYFGVRDAMLDGSSSGSGPLMELLV
ncbi:DUF1552 domain-containing protein [Bremerella sp.]|uniref:DUF1552 domain-containing protein n=1 Tax=Bremerella sp. TaxID=2795602 RepID=UPI003918AEE1